MKQPATKHAEELLAKHCAPTPLDRDEEARLRKYIYTNLINKRDGLLIVWRLVDDALMTDLSIPVDKRNYVKDLLCKIHHEVDGIPVFDIS